MLAAALANAGIADLFDAILSVEEVKVYKPHPSVYTLCLRSAQCGRGSHLLSIFQ